MEKPMSVMEEPSSIEEVVRSIVTLCYNTWKAPSAFSFYNVDDVMTSGNISCFMDDLKRLMNGRCDNEVAKMDDTIPIRDGLTFKIPKNITPPSNWRQVLRIEKRDPDAPIPCHSNDGDAGLDLTTRESAEIRPHETVLLHTGLAFEIPKGWYGAIVPRSGISSKRNLAPINSPGTIDSSYRGEVLVPLHNFGETVERVVAGERICQMIVLRHATCSCEAVDSLDETNRGENGFGSTGRK